MAQADLFKTGYRSILTAALPVASTGVVAAVLLMSPTVGSTQTPGKAADTSAPAASSTTSAPASKASGQAQTSSKGGAAKVKAPVNEKSKSSYSIGVSMGQQLHQLGLSSDTLATEKVMQGFRDGLSGKVTMSPDDQRNIQNAIKSARDNLAEANHAAARAFLADNGKKPDVVTTASGLEYHVVKAGDGTPPKPTDEVTVNYRGTLLDGTEFDSSYKRGQPASFPVNGVIPGWQEALVLMKPGAKWQLFIPPKLAYDTNSPPSIPPGSLLLFEVELLKVKSATPPTPVAPGPQAPDTK